jgi:hypothetical protein
MGHNQMVVGTTPRSAPSTNRFMTTPRIIKRIIDGQVFSHSRVSSDLEAVLRERPLPTTELSTEGCDGCSGP